MCPRVGFVKCEAQWLLMPSSLCSHVLSTTQLGFTFLTLFLMFKSFSWPAPHISCLAVYSWWVWVLLWQRFLRSSAWHRAQMDYSNLPCYQLLLFSVIVTATKVAQHGLILPLQCLCGLCVLVTAHGEVVCPVYQFISSLVWANGYSREPRRHRVWMSCHMFLLKGWFKKNKKKTTDGLKLINFLFSMLQSMCAPSRVSRFFITQ